MTEQEHLKNEQNDSLSWHHGDIKLHGYFHYEFFPDAQLTRALGETPLSQTGLNYLSPAVISCGLDGF